MSIISPIEIKYAFQSIYYYMNLKSLLFYTTYKCNLSCKYCLHNNYQKQISDNFNDNVLNNLGLFIDKHTDKAELLDIGFNGGEPLLQYKTIDNIINTINGIRDNNVFTVITNFAYDIEDQLYVLKKFADICISLDGPHLITNQGRGDGVFEKIMINIDNLSWDIKEKLSFNATINKDNITNLYKTYEWFQNLQFGDVFFIWKCWRYL